MVDILISKKNEAMLNIDCEIGILYELKEHFTFMVEGAKYSPKFKAKMWDGTISLLDLRFGTLPVGLYNELVEVASTLGYSTSIEKTQYGSPIDKDVVTYEKVENFVNSLDIHSKGISVEIREYQIKAVFNCIKNERQISITPTGGGKSLIAYCLYRWYIEDESKTFMLVVPNLGLIKQMFSDFKDYSSHNGFDVEGNTQIIAEGASKEITKSLLICTWQSIYKQPAKWFNQGVDVILMDEVHQGKADCIKGIFEKSTEVKYRFGMTGSLDKSAVNKMVLRGLIGEISREKSTKDLIDDGYLSDIKINCILLKYNAETRKLLKSADYKNEIDFLCQHEKRNKFIRKLALAQKGLTLLLFHYVDTHGIPIYEDLVKHATTQKIHMVHGKVEADDREKIRLLVQQSDGDHIICGSVGTMSTGVNVPGIQNIIFAAPTKSIIRIMQSIGRGLRLAAGKSFLTVYDIADSIGTKSNPNFTMNHFVERLRIYVAEEHKYKIVEMEIE